MIFFSRELVCVCVWTSSSRRKGAYMRHCLHKKGEEERGFLCAPFYTFSLRNTRVPPHDSMRITV